jgi:hypothetical protein
VGGGHPATARFGRVLRNKYAAGAGRVLVGSAAIALLTGRNVAGGDRLQVVTAGRLEDDAQEIAALAEADGLEILWKIDDPKIPTDLRLRRMTVHAVAGGRREPVLDVYNSAAFDLVPYVLLGPATGGRKSERKSWHSYKKVGGPAPPAGLKIGTPFVIMRYKLIDMWTMQVLMNMGIVSADFAKSVLNGMLTSFDAAASYYETELAAAARDPESAALRLLPMTAYIGRLESPELALKRAAQSRAGARFFPPYLPASRFRAPEDGAPEDGAPEDGAPEDGAPEDGAPEDGAPEDGAPEDGVKKRA